MAEQPHGGFSHEVLEADMQRLAREIREHRDRPESEGVGEKELLKQSLRALTPLPTVPFRQTDDTQSPLPKDLQSAPPQAKLEIEYLLDLALHDGIDKANREAAKTTPFVLDAFHDLLVEKLYPELQRRGIVK